MISDYESRLTSFHYKLAESGHCIDSVIIDSVKKFERTSCSFGKSRNEDMAYFVRSDKTDGRLFGYLKCHACSSEPMTWVEPLNQSLGHRNLSDEEFSEKIREMLEDQKIQIGDKILEQLKVAESAKIQWQQATQITATITTPYLMNKKLLTPYFSDEQIASWGLRKWGDELLVSLYDTNGKLWNIERIYPNSDKRPITSGRVDGLFHTIGEINPDGIVQLCEGVATGIVCHAATGITTLCCRNANNMPKVADALKQKYPCIKLHVCADDDRIKFEQQKRKTEELKVQGKKVTIKPENKGLKVAFQIAKKFKATVSKPSISLIGSDFQDIFYELLRQGFNGAAALDTVRQQIQQNSDERIMAENLNDGNQKTQRRTQEEVENRINELSATSKLEYELIRNDEASKLGLRVNILDELIDNLKKKTEEEKSETVLFPKIDPWPDTITLSVLLDEIVVMLKKYVSFNSEHEPKTIALWVIHTYCIEAAYITAILFITSPEMRSGKSTLLAILQKILSKCVAASSITPSVLYRLIPKHQPSIICDEADTYMTEKNEDLRGILNAGHSRDTCGVLRTNPDTFEVELFNAFGAKCLAAINSLPGTVEDRSIIIKMRRKASGQKTEKLRLINEKLRKEFYDVQSKCIKFANDNITIIKTCDPELPDILHDRAADNWYSLFQIATLAGEEWLEDTKKAALYISGIEQENKSLGIELLQDILNLFDGVFKNDNSITTAELIGALCSDDEAPWATYNSKRQDPKITPRQLAKLLVPYGIKSINNVGIDNNKGYSKAAFVDAFTRYIPPETPCFAATSATSATPNEDAASMKDEAKKSSATSRSNRYQDDTLSQPEIADSEYSGEERIEKETQKSSEAPLHIIGADVADKSGKSGMRDYIDV